MRFYWQTSSDSSDESSCSSLSDDSQSTTDDESSDDDCLPSSSMAFGEMNINSEVWYFIMDCPVLVVSLYLIQAIMMKSLNYGD